MHQHMSFSTWIQDSFAETAEHGPFKIAHAQSSLKETSMHQISHETAFVVVCCIGLVPCVSSFSEKRQLRSGKTHAEGATRGGRSCILYRARSRLHRSQILQVDMRWKALAEIYTMHSFAPVSNLKIFVKNC